jgi:hypothetical protein
LSLPNIYLDACRLTVHYVCAILCTIEMTPKMTFTLLCTGCYARYTVLYVRSRRFYISKRKLSRVGLNGSSHKFREASPATRNHAAQNGTQPRCPPYLFCLPVSTNAYLSCRKTLCCLCVSILVHCGGRRHVGRFFVAFFRFPCFTRRIFIPCRLS